MSALDKQDRAACGTEGEAQEPERDGAPDWLPDEAAIVSVETFTSPKGRRYRILRTNLTDLTDPDNRPAAEEDRDP
jgi:hypothetical protein